MLEMPVTEAPPVSGSRRSKRTYRPGREAREPGERKNAPSARNAVRPFFIEIKI
jgi:hypothetical protein